MKTKFFLFFLMLVAATQMKAQAEITQLYTGNSCNANITANETTICSGDSSINLSVNLSGTSGSSSNCFSPKVVGLSNTNFGMNATCSDNNGNLFVAGAYTGNTNFGNNTLAGIGGKDVFLVKYNSCGIQQWALRGGSIGNEDYAGIGTKSIATDASGNIFIVGRYNQTFTFYGINNTSFVAQYTSTSNGNHQDGYLIKINAIGEVIWGATLRGGSNDGFNGVAVDNVGNPIVTGGFNGCCPSTFAVTIYGPNGSLGVSSFGSNYGSGLVVKFDANGNILWKAAVYNRDTGLSRLAIDGTNNIYLVSEFRSWSNGTAAQFIDSNGTNNNLYNPGIGLGFLVKLNSSGIWQWGTSYGNVGDGVGSLTTGTDVAIDENGNPWISGFYRGATATFYSTSGSTLSLPASTNDIGFIAKYSSSGVPQLVNSLQQSTGSTYFSSIAISNGTVGIAGYFTGNNLGSNDMLFAKYDTNAVFQSVNTGGGSGDDQANSVVPNSIGFVVSGAIGGASSIDGVSLNSAGTFLWNNYISGVSSNSFLWSTGETTATIKPTPTETTTYWCDVTTNGATCRKDITITVNTTPAPTASSQSFCNSSTVANLVATGTDLKWYASETGGTALATDVALVSGTYYVSQTINGCESTRTAVAVSVNDPQIIASANTVSSGTAVALTANSGATNSETNSCIGNIGTPNPWSYPNAYDGGYIPLGNFGAQTVFSISMWVSPSETQNGISILLDASHGGSSNWVIQAFGNNTYTWGNMSFDLTPNVWQHLLLTYDNGQRNCYINGQLTRTLYQVISYSGSPNLYLGNWPEGARRFNGLVDELYITNTIQHTSNFTPFSTIDSAGSNCFGLWHFDEGVGSNSLNTATSQNINIGSWNWSTRSNLNTTYAWSTVETTATINPTPTETTTYWCDVTTNGATCRKDITITVNTTPAPTAEAQILCTASTVANLVATGTDLKWYAAESGGTGLATDAALTSGTYYVSQTLNNLESDRTAVQVTVNDALITASASTVSSGTAVELKINQQNVLSPNYSLFHQAGGYFADSNNDDYVVFPVSPTLNTNYPSWTMECWAKIMSPGEEGILSIGNPENGGGNIIGSGWSNTLAAGSNTDAGGGGTISSYNYPTAVWNHFALSYQNGTYRLFLNGILKESWVSGSTVAINNMYPLMTNTHWWWRGGDLSSHRMTVYYDDIRVSKVCRYTSDFIPNTNWNNDTNTIGLWNFNEGSGNTVLDYSGNLNNGIIHGATYSSDVPDTSVNNANLIYSYLWSTGETTSTINPTPTETTTYWCDVTIDGVTCRKEITITVGSLGNEDNTIDLKIKVYPNPTSQLLYVSHPEQKNFSIRITDLSGKQMYSGTITTTIPLDMSKYPQGMYLVTVTNKETSQKNTYKILKK